MNKILLTIIVLAGILLMQGVSYAQSDTVRKGKREELNRLLKEKLIERVGLTESKADRFISAFESNSKEVRVLLRERRGLKDDIELDPGAADIENKLDRSMDIDVELAERKRAFKNELKQFMTPQEVAKTLIFRQKFEKQLRKEIRKKRGVDDTPDRPGNFDDPPPPPPDR